MSSNLKASRGRRHDGPFSWEDTFDFHLAGMVGHDFFKPYAITFDFDAMQIYLRQP
jgi:hypothetical protein